MSLGVSLTRDSGQDSETIQNLAYSSTSVQNGVIFTQYTGAVTICATTACYAKFGTEPTASASNGSYVIGAGVPRKFKVKPGWKVALIRVASDGVASIEESPY